MPLLLAIVFIVKNSSTSPLHCGHFIWASTSLHRESGSTINWLGDGFSGLSVHLSSSSSEDNDFYSNRLSESLSSSSAISSSFALWLLPDQVLVAAKTPFPGNFQSVGLINQTLRDLSNRISYKVNMTTICCLLLHQGYVCYHSPKGLQCHLTNKALLPTLGALINSIRPTNEYKHDFFTKWTTSPRIFP